MKIYFISLTLLSSLLQAQDKEVLTLQQCRVMALKNNSELRAVVQEHKAAQSNHKTAIAKYTPNIYAEVTGLMLGQQIETDMNELKLPHYTRNAKGEYQLDVVRNTAGEIVKNAKGVPTMTSYTSVPASHIEIDPSLSYQANLVLEQPIYAGGKILSVIAQTDIGQEIARENVRFSEANLIYQVDQAYYQLLSVKEKLKLANEYIQMIDTVRQTVKRSFDVQLANRNDLLKANVAYNEAELSVQVATHGLELSRMNLFRIINLDLDADYEIQDDIGSVDDVEVSEYTSIDRRSEYIMLKKKVELFEEKISMAHSDFLPQIGLRLSYGRFEAPEFSASQVGRSFTVRPSGDLYSALINVKIPIFNWFERFNTVNRARIQRDIEQDRFRDRSSLMRLEVNQKIFGLKDAIKRYQLSAKSLEQANENMRISELNYKLGRETISDMLRSKAQWQEIHSKLIDAKIGVKIKRIEYLKATGQLN